MKLIECDGYYITAYGCRPGTRYTSRTVMLDDPRSTFMISVTYQFAHLAFETFILHAAYSYAKDNPHI